MKIQKKYYRIWFGGVLWFFLFFWFIGSYVSATSDCSIVKTILGWTSKKIGFGNLYSDDNFNQALLNLKAFCCESHIFADKTDAICNPDKEYFVDDYPESPYLYDQLVDIALRRLDAVDSPYGLTPDSLGLEWRTYISKKIGEDPSPGSVLSMENTYKKYWDVSPDNTSYTYHPAFVSWSKRMDIKKIKELSLLYTNANLYHRYTESCGIAAQVYLSYVYLFNPSSNVNSRIKNGFRSCQNIVQQRISNELLYTKALMMEKSNALLHKSMSSYLTDYFAKNRLIHLQETITSISNLFLTIAQMLPEGTRQCH